MHTSISFIKYTLIFGFLSLSCTLKGAEDPTDSSEFVVKIKAKWNDFLELATGEGHTGAKIGIWGSLSVAVGGTILGITFKIKKDQKSKKNRFQIMLEENKKKKKGKNALEKAWAKIKK